MTIAVSNERVRVLNGMIEVLFCPDEEQRLQRILEEHFPHLTGRIDGFSVMVTDPNEALALANALDE